MLEPGPRFLGIGRGDQPAVVDCRAQVQSQQAALILDRQRRGTAVDVVGERVDGSARNMAPSADFTFSVSRKSPIPAMSACH